MLLLLYTFLFIVNLAAFIMQGMARRDGATDSPRISDVATIVSGWIGGAYGALMGLLLFPGLRRRMAVKINLILALLVWLAVLITLCLI